ncbi:MAG: hypothetical protein ACE5KH_02440, partial [Candidatus Geothermarchaeales archaeon]
MPDIYQIALGWIHLLAVITWVGGSIFADRILAPSLTSVPPNHAGKLFQAVSKRFTPLAWVAVGLIATT